MSDVNKRIFSKWLDYLPENEFEPRMTTDKKLIDIAVNETAKAIFDDLESITINGNYNITFIRYKELKRRWLKKKFIGDKK